MTKRTILALGILALGCGEAPETRARPETTPPPAPAETPPAEAPDSTPAASAEDVERLLAEIDSMLFAPGTPWPGCGTSDTTGTRILEEAIDAAVEARSLLDSGYVDQAAETADRSHAQLLEFETREAKCAEEANTR